MADVEFQKRILTLTTELVDALKGRYPGWGGLIQLNGTPERLAKMYDENCWSSEEIEKELSSQVRVFDDGYKGMVIIGPATVWSLCPHHLLPCEFRVTIGVVPSGKVLGASKFTRIATILGHRPIMQETYTTELANEVQTRLSPLGTAVYVVGSHSCMTSRGIKQPRDNQMTTCALQGCFKESQAAREEFMLSATRRNYSE